MAGQANLRTGTFDMASLLAQRFVSAAKFGLNTIADVLAADRQTHNSIVRDMVASFIDVTSDALRISGSTITGRMIKADEFTRAPTQRDLPGQTVGFPMDRYMFAIGWTSEWLKRKTPADLAIAQQQAQIAELLTLRGAIQTAIYTPTNSTFVDYLVNNVSLPVKAFYNADGALIPDGPNGQQFNGATHTHYTAAASLLAANITALVATVQEHNFRAKPVIVISTTDETAFRGLTGFTAYVDSRLTLGMPTTLLPADRLDVFLLDNRAIGIFGAAEVWVKPWAIANYAFAYDAGSALKALAYRQEVDGDLQGLRLKETLDIAPLHAEYMETIFGIGVWNRGNGAVHQFNNASYTAPTITFP
jgi:hypothetical protein